MNDATGRETRFEVEAEGLEEFINLLQMREGERAHGVLREAETLPRRAVFVAAPHDQGPGAMGFPVVSRYVRASFAYGEDLVSLRFETSRGEEIPHEPFWERARERHDGAFEETKSSIRERIAGVGLEPHVPVLDGHLRHASSPVSGGGDK